MSLKERLSQESRDALKAGDKARLGALRMAIAAVKQREIDGREPLDDAGVQAVLERLIKQGREARQQYADAGRPELAEKEAGEIAVFEAYLPEPLGDAELEALIAEAIETTGAESMRDMGRVMAAIKARAAGRADLGAVSERVRALLGGP